MRSKGQTVLITALLALALPVLAGCQEEQTQEKPRIVKTEAAAPAGEQSWPALTGQVAARTSLAASFRVSGQITQRLAGAGDHVVKGQALALLDDTILRNTLLSAEADVAASEAALIQAEQHDARVRGLLSQRAVSKENAELSVRQLKAARAQLEAARAQKDSAAEQLGYAVLRAEADGLIVDRHAEAGEVVSAGQPVFSLALDEGRDGLFDLPDALYAEVSRESVLEVCLDRRRDVCTRATVSELSPQADSVTRTYRLRVRLEDPSGMDLGATLLGRLENVRDSLSVPAKALCSVDGAACVWVVSQEDNTVHARAVEVEAYTKDRVFVRSGLAEGELVVTGGVQLLREGMQVRVR